MKALKESFHAFRKNGIGGSDAMYIMGTAPKDWGSIQTLWELKTGRRFPEPPTFVMTRGLKTEPIAREAYQQEAGILMPATRVTHASIDFVRANLDGLNRDLNRGLEIKCPGRDDHAIAKAGKIPEKYLYQCVHNCLAGDLDSLDYFSYYAHGKIDTATVRYERDLKLEKKLLAKEYPFWECVQKDIRPGTKMKEVKMSKPIHPYTKQDIVEILEAAKAMGATLIRLPGYEFAFGLNKNVDKTQDNSSDDNTQQDAPTETCNVCDSELTQGEHSWYCKPCFIRRKEKEKSRSFDNGPFRVKTRR